MTPASVAFYYRKKTMNWLKTLKVRTKLIGGFLIVAAIGALIGTIGVLKAGDLNAMAETMYEREMLGMRHAAEANIQLIAVGRAIRSAVLSYNMTCKMERS